MHARKSSRKSKPGSVQVKISNNRLQLVFSHGGKRHYFSTGLTDSPLHRKLAQDKAFQIQRDIEYGEFDPTLEKYKPQVTLTTVEPVATIATALTMAELWSRYVEIRQVGKSPSTLRMYDWVGNHIDRCPKTLPTEAQAIFDSVVRGSRGVPGGFVRSQYQSRLNAHQPESVESQANC